RREVVGTNLRETLMRTADTPDEGAPAPSRRTVLAGLCGAGAAAVLGGCATYGGYESGGSQHRAASGAAVLAKLTDVPVGGAKILKEQQVVLTRPTAGTVKAFS